MLDSFICRGIYSINLLLFYNSLMYYFEAQMFPHDFKFYLLILQHSIFWKTLSKDDYGFESLH